MKPDPTHADFPHQITMPLRFGDTDQQGHVNNAVYATLFESGRVDIIYDTARGLPPEGATFVLAQININFRAEITFPNMVTICTGVTRLGNASLALNQAIFVGDQLCATADSTVVLTSKATRRSTPLPDGVRDVLASLAMKAST